MALFTNGVDKAAGELEKLRGARTRLAQEDAADRARLAELRAGQGDVELAELIEGGKPPKPGEMGTPAAQLRWNIAGLETAIAGRATARPKLLEKIRGAIQAHAHARAEELRRDAAKLQKQLDAHRGKVAELVDALKQLDGVSYVAQLHEVPPAGFLFMGPGGNPASGLRPIESTSMRLAREITELRRQADAIEATAAQNTAGGRITGGSLDELLAAIGDNPLAPSRPTISAWFERVTAGANAAWDARYARTEPRLIPQNLDVLYSLSWDGSGDILPESEASVHVISPFELEAARQRLKPALVAPA